jgi:hypothetical protein
MSSTRSCSATFMKYSSSHTPTAPALSRRKFILAGGAAATTFSIIPRHVLGGAGFVAPSEKLTMACIGCGTQALRELPGLLGVPEIQFVAACDPVKDSHDYVDWSADGIRSTVGQAMGQPDWRRNRPGIPGGREVVKEVVETVYARQRGAEGYQGCTTYVDFRELLEQESDLNAVWVMTPDHLHASVAIAAMKKGRHVRLHKPLANRLDEARAVIRVAAQAGVATHFQPASDGARLAPIQRWLDEGAIGAVREVHNWSSRPMWPQYATLPTDQPPIPADFDWQLWLGPSRDRPYHPHYTHAVFRGWYEFGGGSLADMGHYSLWPIFQHFDLDAPYCVESTPSHVCVLRDHVAVRVRNDYSFPAACVVRFRFAAKTDRPALDLFWYDGSMKPPTPDEVLRQDIELADEGMMLVGDRGKIIGGFHGNDPRLLVDDKIIQPPAASGPDSSRQSRGTGSWIAAFKGGPSTYGDFRYAGPISDAFNLGAVSLRLGGRRLLFDSAAGRITNAPEANRLLTRDYRPGWEL